MLCHFKRCKKNGLDTCNPYNDLRCFEQKDQTCGRNGAITELSDHRPHVVIAGERTHVIPVSVLLSVAEGKIKWSEIEDSGDIAPQIIDWFIKTMGT